MTPEPRVSPTTGWTGVSRKGARRGSTIGPCVGMLTGRPSRSKQRSRARQRRRWARWQEPAIQLGGTEGVVMRAIADGSDLGKRLLAERAQISPGAIRQIRTEVSEYAGRIAHRAVLGGSWFITKSASRRAARPARARGSTGRCRATSVGVGQHRQRLVGELIGPRVDQVQARSLPGRIRASSSRRPSRRSRFFPPPEGRTASGSSSTVTSPPTALHAMGDRR